MDMRQTWRPRAHFLSAATLCWRTAGEGPLRSMLPTWIAALCLPNGDPYIECAVDIESAGNTGIKLSCKIIHYSHPSQHSCHMISLLNWFLYQSQVYPRYVKTWTRLGKSPNSSNLNSTWLDCKSYNSLYFTRSLSTDLSFIKLCSKVTRWHSMVIVQHQVVGHSCLHPHFFFKIINHILRTHNSLSQNVAITWSVSGKFHGYTCNIQDCGENSRTTAWRWHDNECSHNLMSIAHKASKHHPHHE